MWYKMLNALSFVRNAADEQLKYESFLQYIDENMDKYQEITVLQLKEMIKVGCDDLNLSHCRNEWLFNHVINAICTQKG